MRQAEMMKRVAAAAGVESTFVDAVLSRLTSRITGAMVRGYRVSLYPLGIFWSGKRAETYRKVVVKGGGRAVKRCAPRAVPRFRSVRRWDGAKFG